MYFGTRVVGSDLPVKHPLPSGLAVLEIAEIKALRDALSEEDPAIRDAKYATLQLLRCAYRGSRSLLR
jgi:hypothetical protein